MATRRISEIIEDLRTTANDGSLDVSVFQGKMNECAAELEAVLKKEKADGKFFGIMGLLLLFFIGAFAIITLMYNDDLREDVTTKKEIITKYEESVRYDTIHTYFDKNGKEITIPSLLDDNLRLMNRISALETEISIYILKLDIIKNNYGIEIVKNNNEFYVEAKEADSARILLSAFRDRLKYDSIKGRWTVTHRLVQIDGKTYPE